MIVDENPKPAVYKLKLLYTVERGATGPEHDPPETAVYTTTSPPVLPRVGDTYSRADDPPDGAPSGWTSVPWSVEGLDHTVWSEADKIVFETCVYLSRDKEHVTTVARENEARFPNWKTTRAKS